MGGCEQKDLFWMGCSGTLSRSILEQRPGIRRQPGEDWQEALPRARKCLSLWCFLRLGQEPCRKASAAGGWGRGAGRGASSGGGGL